LRTHLLVAALIVGIVASSLLSFPQVHAATGANFDNVVIIAMENQNYVDVMGTGTGSPNAPFTGTILSSGHSATYPNYHSYGAGIGGCSAGCYEAFITGMQTMSDGYSCCTARPTVVDSLTTAGLTWQAYCESGCPRGPDHFPFIAFTPTSNSPNIFASGGVSTSTFIASANSATPPNFLWFTPTDSHNMHDNSIQTGDSYLQSFLVGSGSLSSPSSGSLLASSLFQPGHRTLLMLWWDEYDPSPQLLYSPTLLTSSSIDNGNSYTEYSWLHLIEQNWGLPTLTSNDAAAVLPTVFAGPQPLSTSLTYLPSAPIINSPVTFTATTTGGTGPYSISWNFGDGATGTGSSATHTYTTAQSFTVTETATDSSSPPKTATSTKTLTITIPPPPSTSFTFLPSTPVINSPVTFTSTTTGGTAPYTVTWNFGDGTTGTGATTTHTYTTAQSFSVTETATDSSTPSQKATSSQTIPVVTALPLFTSFTFLPVNPTVNSPVSLTATTTGGTLPYTINWNFGDGSTATGATATHTYTSAQSFTVTETATDSSSPTQTVTSTLSVIVSSSLTGNFDNTWFINNCPGGTETISNGVLQTRQSTPGGGSNSYGYCTAQRGTFPWHSTVGTALPSGITSVTVSFNFLSRSLLSGSRYHLYVALYYQIPSSTSGSTTYSWLDTQSRVENINGVDSSVGSTATYDPGDSFGWDIVTLQINPGQTGILSADATQLCQGDLAAWGLPANTQCTLQGIEVGTEGYLVNSVNVDWYNVNLNVGPIPLSTSFTVQPLSPIVNTPVTFTASTTGGTAPYSISWNFGDGSTGTGASVVHTFTSVQSFTVTETATDSSSPSQSATSSKVVIVQPIPPLSTSFTFLPTTPLVNAPVTFTAVTTGGALPYAVTWNFGDGTTGTGATITHSYTNAGAFTVTETATDSSPTAKTATSSQSVTVYLILPLSISSFQASNYSPQVGQSITLTGLATGGTAPYAYTITFGDGASRARSSSTHTYSVAGSYTATLTITDSASAQATVSASITINVLANPPTLTIPGNQTIIAGTWINFTVRAASVNTGGTIALSATGLPAGATFDQTTGVFSWKPSASQTGSYIVIFTTTDGSDPSSPTSKPMEIQVNQAAPGGSNGGNGGSGGGSNGSCLFCGVIPKISTNLSLLVIGGLLGLVASLALLTIKARASLEQTKRRLNRLTREE
jgi:PKD repeat protein